MNKIGLYFGSFNPIHIGHLLVATHIKEAANFDEIWFVVSPHNPFKQKNELADENHRINMAKFAIENIPYFKVEDIELHLPQPSYTHRTLEELVKRYPDYEFNIIIGEDNVAKLQEWKEIEWIKKHFYIIVYNRTNKTATKTVQNTLKYYELPLIDISSTEIRKRIQENKQFRFFVPDAVEQYITFHKLYS
ncbi:MAG TPA: nicotinate (nicotinamide) nucleotide adenylyltransferase [Chitinophagales bacterium]|nr:nicotinate (nicotinamide) nucleotide adenylyltransferase [Chitinophagales bacterium]HMX60138.1 nicotinate (nicotinamide) nucleotide adenylyltransferase [Chitinophagales bacterium]HMY22810.1 nicotinate (nicotinamide) nucleotide adenylyltransferase [Chitinophagales bacterium]HMZ34266.1 nicotinate (nicotinamide) nucleotide adenylyltransferase [Chitinophagales bacterium]HNA38048.1 nicotinate (nicotinamide) nucleotide adenylyltransferase [Chitinophagales bacterium]